MTEPSKEVLRAEAAHYAELREWARGAYDSEAGTELLIRGFDGHYAAPGQPWIRRDLGGKLYIDFEDLPEHIGGHSGGQRRFLLLAASLGGGRVEVDLANTVTYLDYREQDLVLQAIRHAGGRRVWEAPRQDRQG